MAIRSCYRTLILALLFSAMPLANVQAGPFALWVAKWFTGTYRTKFSQVYPLNMAAQSLVWSQCIMQDLAVPVDNAEVQKMYPCACAYVQKELEKVGINPATVRLINVDQLLDSKSVLKTLRVTLSMLEAALGDKEKTEDVLVQGNRTKEIIAHEIGHLRNRSVSCSVFIPLVSIAGTETLARYCFPMRMQWCGLVLKTLCSQALVNVCQHYDEYRADTYAIKRFKSEPQVLVDAASFWLAHHQQEPVAFLASAVAAGITVDNAKKYIPFLYYKPMRNAALHWIIDVHGSHILRANRLLKAAGLPSTPSILAHELLRQHNEAPGTCDFSRIKAVIEDKRQLDEIIDAVELPEVFKLYWT